MSTGSESNMLTETDVWLAKKHLLNSVIAQLSIGLKR